MTNQNMNRAYNSVASKFMRSFAKTHLSRGGPFHVKRKVQTKKAPKGQPSIGVKARKAGFKATLSGQQSLSKKSLEIRTRNPLLLIREFGGPIRPKRKTRGRGKRDIRGYLAVDLSKGKTRRGRKSSKKGGNIRLVREINQKPVLGFRQAWRRFRSQAKQIVEKGLSDSVRRINKQFERRQARRAG